MRLIWNREKLTKAYEFALDNVGLDMNSTSVSFTSALPYGSAVGYSIEVTNDINRQ